MTTGIKKKILEVIARDIERCESCGLCSTPGKSVPGEGNPDTYIAFVGEAPGATEAEMGRPFVGRAGKLLDNMIKSMGIERQDVWIGNICKHRPPNNRKPTREEMDACLPYLRMQLHVIQPRIIIAMGATAIEGLIGQYMSVTKNHGIMLNLPWYPGEVLMTYHPSALLRNPKWKDEAWYDLQKARTHLQQWLELKDY